MANWMSLRQAQTDNNCKDWMSLRSIDKLRTGLAQTDNKVKI